MKIILLAALLTGMGLCSYAQNAEKIIKTYFSGWEKKDWKVVADQLAEGFTFTSPAGDDHLSIAEFKEKCWMEADYIKRVEFVKIVAQGNEAFALMHVLTTENKIVRNTELYTFSNGKIRSIEVFFGGTGAGYPSNAK